MEYQILLDASKNVAKGVIWKSSTQSYTLKRLVWISNTKHSIEANKYMAKRLKKFTIHERGKLRQIRSYHISDRTVQKSFNNAVLKPKIYPRLIYDNGASQKGKGTDFSINRLKTHLHKFYRQYGNNGYALVMDFSNYFGNINKGILVQKLSKVLTKDELEFAKLLIEDGEDGLGLGSEVNQTCAIFYANDLDHYIKEKLRIKYYARYMDDSYLIHNDREYLRECLDKIHEICNRDGIVLNAAKCKIINLKSDNLNFLKKQFRLTDTGKVIVRPLRINYVRRVRRLNEQKSMLAKEYITKESLYNSYQSWKGHISQYNAPYYLVQQIDNLYREVSNDKRRNI